MYSFGVFPTSLRSTLCTEFELETNLSFGRVPTSVYSFQDKNIKFRLHPNIVHFFVRYSQSLVQGGKADPGSLDPRIHCMTHQERLYDLSRFIRIHQDPLGSIRNQQIGASVFPFIENGTHLIIHFCAFLSPLDYFVEIFLSILRQVRMDSRVSGSWTLNSHRVPGNGTSTGSRVPANETYTGCQVPRNGIRTGSGFLGTELARIPVPGNGIRNGHPYFQQIPLGSILIYRQPLDIKGSRIPFLSLGSVDVFGYCRLCRTLIYADGSQ